MDTGLKCWKKLWLMSNMVSLMSKGCKDMWFQGGNDDVVVVNIYCLGIPWSQVYINPKHYSYGIAVAHGPHEKTLWVIHKWYKSLRESPNYHDDVELVKESLKCPKEVWRIS